MAAGRAGRLAMADGTVAVNAGCGGGGGCGGEAVVVVVVVVVVARQWCGAVLGVPSPRTSW